MTAASVPGSRHERERLPCQDAWACTALPNGLLLAAVADGAGSASHSDIGARLAVEAAVATLARTFSGDLLQARRRVWTGLTRALEAAGGAVREESARRGLETAALATTLLMAVVFPDALFSAQVGDGAMVVRWPNQALAALPRPQRGEYLNETQFVTSADAVDLAALGAWPTAPRQLALFTDGLEQLVLRAVDGRPHDPFFASVFAFCGAAEDMDLASAELARLLCSPRVRQRCDDDLTLLVASRAKDE